MVDDEWQKTRMEMGIERQWYLVGTPYYGNLEYVRARIQEANIMAKIYRRDNLVSGVVPKKKNEKNRKRSVIVNFRVTPEEKQLVDERIALSGLPKAEFFIQSCMHQKVITFGNVKTFDAIRKKLLVIDEHLQAVEKS